MQEIMIVPKLSCEICHNYTPNICVECFNKNGKKKKISETYEELKEILLNKYKNDKRYIIKIGLNGDIYFDNVKTKRNSLTICKKDNGNIIIYDDEWSFAHNRTPEQALNIIENLMD